MFCQVITLKGNLCSNKPGVNSVYCQYNRNGTCRKKIHVYTKSCLYCVAHQYTEDKNNKKYYFLFINGYCSKDV